MPRISGSSFMRWLRQETSAFTHCMLSHSWLQNAFCLQSHLLQPFSWQLSTWSFQHPVRIWHPTCLPSLLRASAEPQTAKAKLLTRAGETLAMWSCPSSTHQLIHGLILLLTGPQGQCITPFCNNATWHGCQRISIGMDIAIAIYLNIHRHLSLCIYIYTHTHRCSNIYIAI